MSDGSEEKTDDASDRKLRQLRDKGILPSAPTGSDFAGFGVGLTVTILLVPLMIERLGQGFDRAFQNLTNIDPSDGFPSLQTFLLEVNAPLLGILASVAVGAIAFKLLSNGGFVFAMEKVQPKLSHVDPVQGVRKLFKGDALTNFIFSLTRLCVMSVVVAGLGWWFAPTLLRLDLCMPGCAWPIMWEISRGILIAVAVLIILSMLADIAAQRAFFLIEQRMTKSEVKRERKEMMGTPEIRQARRRLAREMVEDGAVVGGTRATIYFYWGDALVAFAFHPTRIPLPKIASRAFGADNVGAMRVELDSYGVQGFESEVIVEASKGQSPGESAKREIFMELASALRKVM